MNGENSQDYWKSVRSLLGSIDFQVYTILALLITAKLD